ncbi:MAG: CocE/NonD family hydrolase [Planctomycetota bacterium]|jgi:putative CocE/NonD family hydrolase
MDVVNQKPLTLLAVFAVLGVIAGDATAQCAKSQGNASLKLGGTPIVGRSMTAELKGRQGGAFILALGSKPVAVTHPFGTICLGPVHHYLRTGTLLTGSLTHGLPIPFNVRLIDDVFSLQGVVSDSSAPNGFMAISNVVSTRLQSMPEQYTMVRMRDSVTIRTYVRAPLGKGPWPAVLKKGYSITSSDADTFTKAGYVYVSQGVRAGADPHGISGDARFFADDVDGYDTIEWIAAQPWCDGNVAMFGPSYWGATQWLAAANGYPGPPPHLKAIVPSVINPDFWLRAYRVHGAMNLSMTAISRAFSKERATYDNYMYLPLIDMDKAVGGRENTLWNEYVLHGTYDKYWAHIGMRDKYRRIKIPVYIYAGWWDYYPGAALKYYNLMRALGHTSEIRVWVGNGGHSQMSRTETIRWLDWVIKGKDNGMKKQPPVRVFVQGVNQERYYNQWPPPRMQPTKYYLHSPTGSRTGTLDTSPPGAEPPTRYAYDPRQPVPSIGGNANHRSINKTLKSGAVLREGSFDQRSVEGRSDVLVFTSATLQADVEVIGPVSLKLYAATDARDTDFTAVLIDVEPGGNAMNVTEGIMRARFRESVWGAPRLLTPNETYEYTVELLPTARVFRKGHRIRLHLSSSRFPLWDRNTNTGNDPATDKTTRVAQQTIFHDSNRPSQLVLPIIR